MSYIQYKLTYIPIESCSNPKFGPSEHRDQRFTECEIRPLALFFNLGLLLSSIGDLDGRLDYFSTAHSHN